MNKPVKIVLFSLAVLAVLVAVGVAVIVTSFDPERYKPLLVEQVQSRWQRTLAVPGPVQLSFWPKLGVQIGEISLSDRDSSSIFASARSARVALAVWPLLRQQVVVDRVLIEGLRANLVREADGRTSMDDLLGLHAPETKDDVRAKASASADRSAAASAASSPALAFEVAGIELRDAAITLDDRSSQRRLNLSALEISTGRLAPGVAGDLRIKGRLGVTSDKPAQALELALTLQGQLKLDPAQQRHALDALSLTLQGPPAGGQPSASLKLGGALTAELPAGRIELQQLTVDASWPRAGAAAAQLKASGQVLALIEKKTLDAQLSGTVEGSAFKARVGMSRFSPAAYSFDIDVDRLDLDRLAAASPASPGQTPAAAPPVDLSALRELDAQGQLRIGALTVAQLKLSELRAELRAQGGQVNIQPLTVSLYQGQLSGQATLDARSADETPRLSLRQSLSGVHIGPLLKDLLGRDSLEGRGDVKLDVQAQGGSVVALTRSLAGSAHVDLADGALRGVNVAQIIRGAKAAFSGGDAEQQGAGSRTEKTDFSALTASFRIAGGVARNDDLLAQSPLLRIAGQGDIDLGAQSLDYLVKATVVATLQGQGGPELQALRGQTVPVRLSGPFDAIGWRIDMKALAQDAVKEKLEGKVERAKDKLREQLGDKLKGLFGR